MGTVVEAEPPGNRAYLIAGFAKRENRRLGAHSLDVLHRRDAHFFAEGRAMSAEAWLQRHEGWGRRKVPSIR